MHLGRALCILSLGFSSLNPVALRAQENKPPAKAAATSPAKASSVYPLDTVVDGDGTAYVVDRSLPGIWRSQKDELKLFVQGPKRFREPLNAPRCIAIDKSGHILVGDSSTREIYRIAENQKPQPLTGGAIGIPMDIAVRADGSLMVADAETRSLLHVSADGKNVQAVAKVNPRGVFVDREDKVWIVSQDAQQLQIIDDSGKSKVIVEKRIFEFPHQVVVDSHGHAFVSDGYKKAIWKVVPGSAPEVVVSGAPLDNPVGLWIVNDQVIITDPRARKVFRLIDGKCEPWLEVLEK